MQFSINYFGLLLDYLSLIYGLFAPRTFRPMDTLPHGRTFCPMGVSPHGRIAPQTIRPKDD